MRTLLSAGGFIVLLSCLACGSGKGTSPTAPSPPPASPAPGEVLPRRTIRGVVQTAEGVPLAGVRITSAFGDRTVSDVAGAFTLSYPGSNGPSACFLVAEADGFETRTVGWGIGTHDVTVAAVVLYARLEMSEDLPRVAVLVLADPSWFVGEAYEDDNCEPCHRIHLASTPGRHIRLDLSWTGTTPLHLWAVAVKNGRYERAVTAAPSEGESNVSLSFTADAETLILVGLPWSRYGKPAALTPVPYRLTATSVQ